MPTDEDEDLEAYAKAFFAYSSMAF